jgi:hypothetical protein
MTKEGLQLHAQECMGPGVKVEVVDEGYGWVRATASTGGCFGAVTAKIEISMRESYGDVREILADALVGYKAQMDKQYKRNAVQRAAVLESARKARERRRKAEDAVRRATAET